MISNFCMQQFLFYLSQVYQNRYMLYACWWIALLFWNQILSLGEKGGKGCITEFTEILLYSTFGYTLSNTHRDQVTNHKCWKFCKQIISNMRMKRIFLLEQQHQQFLYLLLLQEPGKAFCGTFACGTALLSAKRPYKVWTYDSDNLDWLNSGKMFEQSLIK